MSGTEPDRGAAEALATGGDADRSWDADATREPGAAAKDTPMVDDTEEPMIRCLPGDIMVLRSCLASRSGFGADPRSTGSCTEARGNCESAETSQLAHGRVLLLTSLVPRGAKHLKGGLNAVLAT